MFVSEYRNTHDYSDDEHPHAQNLSFTHKLFDIVSDERNREIVSWNPDGESFEVFDPKGLEREVLPKYFRHSRFQSLVRQLNFYNFKKVGKERSSWIYCHEYFKKDHPDLLNYLKRKTNFGGVSKAFRSSSLSPKAMKTATMSSEPTNRESFDSHELHELKDESDVESQSSLLSDPSSKWNPLCSAPSSSSSSNQLAINTKTDFTHFLVMQKYFPLASPSAVDSRNKRSFSSSSSDSYLSDLSYLRNVGCSEEEEMVTYEYKYLSSILEERSISVHQFDELLFFLQHFVLSLQERQNQQTLEMEIYHFLLEHSEVASEFSLYLQALNFSSDELSILRNDSEEQHAENNLIHEITRYFLRYSLNLLQDIYEQLESYHPTSSPSSTMVSGKSSPFGANSFLHDIKSILRSVSEYSLENFSF